MKNEQRYPLLLIDRVEEVAAEKVRAIKNVSLNEKVFVGHFPRQPIYPAVYIVEGLCQCAQILLGAGVAVTAKLEDFKFLQRVVPGDRLHYEVEREARMGKFLIVKARATVDGATVSTGRIVGASMEGA